MDATFVKIFKKTEEGRKCVSTGLSIASQQLPPPAALTARVMTFQVWATEDSFGRDRKTPGS